MSFGGFGTSTGDLIAVGTFAWNVYKACKGASAEFEEVSHEVIALHTAIKELEDEARNTDSILNRAGSGKRNELDEIIRNCGTVLTRLEKLLTKYKSLGTKSKRTWDRIKFGAEGLQAIREKLTFHTSGINLFLTTLGTGSLGWIEKKLDEIVGEIRAGKREPTLLTTVDDDNEEAETHWNALKRELLDEGFTRQDIEAHKRSVKLYLQELIDRGELQEVSRPHVSAEEVAVHRATNQLSTQEIIENIKPTHDPEVAHDIPIPESAQSQPVVSHLEDRNDTLPLRLRDILGVEDEKLAFPLEPISKGVSHSQPLPHPASRPASGVTLSQPSNPIPGKQSKWSPEEDALIIDLKGSGMKWEQISERLPGRSAIGCRIHYQNYLEKVSAPLNENGHRDVSMQDLPSQKPNLEATSGQKFFHYTDRNVDGVVSPGNNWRPLPTLPFYPVSKTPPLPGIWDSLGAVSNSNSYVSSPSLKRRASGALEEYHEDVSEYDELGRLRKRTVVRRGSSPAMPSHHSSPIPSPSSWGHASPASGYGSIPCVPQDSRARGHASPASGNGNPFFMPQDSYPRQLLATSQSFTYGASPISILPDSSPMTVAADPQAASKEEDEKRAARNRGAVARFRARRIARELESRTKIQNLEGENLRLTDKIKDLKHILSAQEHGSFSGENADLAARARGLMIQNDDLKTREAFYREDRNYFRTILSSMPGMQDLIKQRPASPTPNHAWPKLESPKPESPMNTVQEMLRETEAMEMADLKW